MDGDNVNRKKFRSSEMKFAIQLIIQMFLVCVFLLWGLNLRQLEIMYNFYVLKCYTRGLQTINKWQITCNKQKSGAFRCHFRLSSHFEHFFAIQAVFSHKAIAVCLISTLFVCFLSSLSATEPSTFAVNATLLFWIETQRALTHLKRLMFGSWFLFSPNPNATNSRFHFFRMILLHMMIYFKCHAYFLAFSNRTY